MTGPQVHVVADDSRGHRPFPTCPCGPMLLGHDMAEPAILVFRHRSPGGRGEVPSIAPVLESALAAWRDGFDTPLRMAQALGIPSSTAKARLAALRDLGLIPRPGHGEPADPTAEVHRAQLPPDLAAVQQALDRGAQSPEAVAELTGLHPAQASALLARLRALEVQP